MMEHKTKTTIHTSPRPDKHSRVSFDNTNTKFYNHIVCSPSFC